jgi:plastocyanin
MLELVPNFSHSHKNGAPHNMRTIARIALTIAVCTAACGDDDSGGPADPVENEDAASVIASVGLRFEPATVNIITGGLVNWIFQSVVHTVTFTAGTGAPTNIVAAANTSISRTFPTAGVYSYHCLIHPEMTGTVRVGQ